MLEKAENTYILAIETSCDETAAAVLLNGRRVLSNIIDSQIDTHKLYGGVVPEIASRKHVEKIGMVVDEALKTAKIDLNDIDAVAVTYGPGLVGALLVGLSYGKSLAYSIKKPLIGVHHIEGHICANYLEIENKRKDFKPPFICLVVSGGHTNIIHVRDYGEYETIGKTRDDAAGEAFDKVARALGLGYPGGPKIDELAKKGNPDAIVFPKAFVEKDNFDFSFSGLKSSVLNYLNKCQMSGLEISKEDVAASFQKSVVEVLVFKTIQACQKFNINKVAMAGGVSCNNALRNKMEEECLKYGYNLNVPPTIFCTDNAAMIGSCGYFQFLKGYKSDLDLNAYSNLYLF